MPLFNDSIISAVDVNIIQSGGLHTATVRMQGRSHSKF